MCSLRTPNSGALAPFWKKVRRAGARIQAVASDLSAAYRLSVVENAPDAAHVFDRFHIVKLYNPLAQAYYMKDDLQRIWQQPDKATARRALEDWISQAESSTVIMLRSYMQGIVRSHRDESRCS